MLLIPNVVPTSTRPPVKFIDNVADARRVLDAASKAPDVAIDTEFDSSKDNHIKCVVWSLSWGKGIRYVLTGDLLVPVFGDWLTDAKTKLVYQHYRADADVFEDAGLDTDASFHADILIMDWCHDETDVKHGLKHQGGKWLNWRRKDYTHLFCYLPEGRKDIPRNYVTISPTHLMYGPLPPDAELVHDQATWRRIFLNYSGDDAEETHALFRLHRTYLAGYGYWPTYLKIDRQFTLTLKAMQKRGIQIDVPRMLELRRIASFDKIRSRFLFREMCGNDTVNPGSSQQLQKMFFDDFQWPIRNRWNGRDKKWEPDPFWLTKTSNKETGYPHGYPRLNQPMLAWYATEHGFELAEALLAHKRSIKLAQDINGILNGRSEDDRLRSDFNQVTNTGRISSRKYEEWVEDGEDEDGETTYTKKKKGANLQNVVTARKDTLGIRRGFIPSPGNLMVVADYSGFELLWQIHWASLYAPDSVMLKLMKQYGSPSAIHGMSTVSMANPAEVAAKLKLTPGETAKLLTYLKDGHLTETKKKLGEFFYEVGKRCNFNLGYRGGAKMLARILGRDWNKTEEKKRTERDWQTWHDTFPEIGAMQKGQIKFGYAHGYVLDISGRRMNVEEGLNSEDESVVHHWETKCVNGPCQGSAAVAMRHAQNLIEADAELRLLEYQQDTQVHDEIVGEAPKSTAEGALQRLVEIMKAAPNQVADIGKQKRPSFAFAVEGKTGDNWQEAK